jgi:hypothetical protein
MERRRTMRKVVWLLSIILTLSFVPLAGAQFGKTSGPKFYSDFKPVVGGWSEYQLTSKGMSPSKMRIAIVGREGDAYWYETVMEGQGEGKIISKMLVSGDPADQKNVKRIIIKTGNEPAMEIPAQMMGHAAKPGEQKGKMIDKGPETLKVPAGTFKTEHFQYQDGETMVDTWVYKDASPYGMIKSQSKDFEMVLLGYGTGAKTMLTETPQKLEIPQMPQMPQMPFRK